MSDTEDIIEEYELAIEELLVALDENELNTLAAGLKIDEQAWKGKRKILVLRRIRHHLEKVVEEKDELSDKKIILETVLDTIDTMQTASKKAKKIVKKMKRDALKSEEDNKLILEQLTSTHVEMNNSEDSAPSEDEVDGDNESETKSSKPKTTEGAKATSKKNGKTYKAAKNTVAEDTESSGEEVEANKRKPVTSLNILKKDFVIVGKVGDPSNEKDIGYLGIVRQMREGIEKGYHESEIVAAVLKVIIPKSLRSYLGMTKRLKIAKLSQVLRIHYHEKSATDLYQEIISMKQQKKEDATAFVIRALETREKIIFASQENDEVTYDQTQVQKLCMSSIESGIDAEVAAIIRPSLDPKIDDIVLMQEVNKAQASLKMRKQKSEGANNNKQMTTTVGAIGADDDSDVLRMMKELKSSLGCVNDLKKDMQSLRKELSDMKGDKSERKSSYSYDGGRSVDGGRRSTDGNGYRQSDGRRRPSDGDGYRQSDGHRSSDGFSTKRRTDEGPPKCQTCSDEHKETCDHCFKCGSSDHFARGCKHGPGNSRGLSGRGRR